MKSYLFADLTTGNLVWPIIIKTILVNQSSEQRWEVRLRQEASMRKIPLEHICPTRILPLPGGPVPQKPGGRWLPKTMHGWEVLYGPDLITAASLLPINGQMSHRILASWTFVDFLKIFITTTRAGGRTKMCCISHRTGTGKERKGNQLMYG